MRREMTASPMQTAAAVFGGAFLAIGVLGFVPGITTDYSQMEFAGRDSEAKLLGLFEVSIFHNLVHLAFGVVGLAMARTATAARLFLLVGGLAYLVLFVYGLVIDLDEAANFIPVNSADNWLHLTLAVGMVAAAMVLGRPAGDARGGARTRETARAG